MLLVKRVSGVVGNVYKKGINEFNDVYKIICLKTNNIDM